MISAILRGGLCNQLFIMAATIAQSIKVGTDYYLPLEVENPHYISNPDLDKQKPYIFPNVKYRDERRLFEYTYNEPHFHYAALPFKSSLLLNGYFQSFKFIYPYRDEILKAFGFDNIETKQGFCSIHYRSGDYNLYPTMHPKISKEYITEAVSRMKLNGYNKFIVFSDSIDEIKGIIKSCPFDKRLSFEYSEGKTELEDLRLMASCSSQITANSSFSLWAAYINPNPEKIVISPLRWFGEDLIHDTKDLYLPNTIIL